MVLLLVALYSSARADFWYMAVTFCREEDEWLKVKCLTEECLGELMVAIGYPNAQVMVPAPCFSRSSTA